MSSIAEQLTRINAAKESLSGVLVENGITPPATFEEYADAASGINLAYREAFGGLVDGTISAVESSEITSIRGYALQGGASLASVSFPAATSTGNYAFAACTSLSAVSLPNASSIGNYSFANCTRLSAVSFPNASSLGQYVFCFPPEPSRFFFARELCVLRLHEPFGCFASECNFDSGWNL